MGVSAADAREMSIWEYEARIHHWNESHGDGDPEVVDPEITQSLVDRLNSRPELMRTTKPAKV